MVPEAYVESRVGWGSSPEVGLRTGMQLDYAGLGLGLVSIHTLQLELETSRLSILDV